MTPVKVFVLAGSALAALLLILGLLLPYASEIIDGSTRTASILTYGFLALSTSDSAGGVAILGIAFFALTVIVLAMLVGLVVIVRGNVRRTTPITLTATLLLLGTLGARIVMFVGLSSPQPDWSFEPGLPLMTLGGVLVAVLVFVPPLRKAWT